jgi:hypothetical protein
MPAGSNVPNGFGGFAEYFKFPEISPMSMLPQANGDMDNRQFNPIPSGPLLAPFLMNSPQSSQLSQQPQSRSSVGPPIPPSGVPSQVAAQSEPQKEQADIVQAEDQDGQNKNDESQYNDRKNNNYRSEQTHADDDIFKQYTNVDEIHAENSLEQV